jgi:hypothetical protein
MGPLEIAEIETTDGILEDTGGRLGGVHGTAVAALLQEVKFEFQDLKDIALIGHAAPPHLGRLSRALHGAAVTYDTKTCDGWPF